MAAAPSKEDTFDWKGDAGDKFAEWNPGSADGFDGTWEKFFGKKATGVLDEAVAAAEAAGMPARKGATVFDIGCSTGGALAVLEKIGFSAGNLHGVDLSDKAIEINRKAHPDYSVQCVSGYGYKPTVERPDLVYHTGVLCQIPEDGYKDFFTKIEDIRPKFYMFVEGISTKGYVKAAHGGHHHHHHHHHAHHGHKDSGDASDDVPMTEGFHYANDVGRVVGDRFPGARLVHTQKLEYPERNKDWFTDLGMDYHLCNVYRFEQ